MGATGTDYETPKLRETSLAKVCSGRFPCEPRLPEARGLGERRAFLVRNVIAFTCVLCGVADMNHRFFSECAKGGFDFARFGLMFRVKHPADDQFRHP